MLDVPQITRAIFRGYSPWSCRYRSSNRSASIFPQFQEVWVGTARGSMPKKFLPVGRTSIRPRVGAPEGPGGTNWPLRPFNTFPISSSQRANLGMSWSRTKVANSSNVSRSAFGVSLLSWVLEVPWVSWVPPDPPTPQAPVPPQAALKPARVRSPNEFPHRYQSVNN